MKLRVFQVLGGNLVQGSLSATILGVEIYSVPGGFTFIIQEKGYRVDTLEKVITEIKKQVPAKFSLVKST